MLTQTDRDNFVETGKQASEIGFPVYSLADALRHTVYQPGNPAFFGMVNMIALNDDGRIDEKEAKLLTWARELAFRFEEPDIWEAEHLMHQGFFASR